MSTSLDPADLLPMPPSMPPDTGPRVLYIDADDDLAGLLDRVEESGLPAVVVLPEGARAVHGMVAARLLQRRAEAAGILVIAVTSDRMALAQLRGVGIPTANTVGEARRLLPGAPGSASPSPPLSRPLPLAPARVLPSPLAPPAIARTTPPPLRAAPALGRVSAPAVPIDLPDYEDEGEEDDPLVEPLRQGPIVVTRARSAAPRPWRSRFRLLILALSGLALILAAWVVFFPSATIVITYSATAFSRTYTAIAAPGAAEIPLHTTHLRLEGTRTVLATGVTTIPDGFASGSVTLANTLSGMVVVPVGTMLSTRSGASYTTQVTVNVPGATHSFSGTTYGQASVAVRAVAAGTDSNADAGAVTMIGGRFSGVLLVTNPGGIAGGTMREIYRVTAQDVSGAVQALRTDLTRQAIATLQDRYARSPGRLITGSTADRSRVQAVTQNGRLYARVSTAVLVMMSYLHQEDIDRFAERRQDADLAAINLSPVAGTLSRSVQIEHIPGGDRVRVQKRGQAVPAIDTANLRGLLTGQPVVDARKLLDDSARYGNWTYTIHTSPDWAQRLPQAAALIEIVARRAG